MPAGGGGPGRSSFHRGGEKPSEDTDYLITGNYRFQFDRRQNFGLYGGDTIKIYSGMLSGQVFEACLLENGFERNIKRKSTVWGYLAFVPVLTFLTAGAGVICYKNNALTVEIGSMSLILAMVYLYLIR